MDITQIHDQTIFSNESSYANDVSSKSKKPNDSKVIAYRANKGLWLTQASDGLRFKKGLSDGSLGLSKITRVGSRYLEYIPFTPTIDTEQVVTPVETENYSIVLYRYTDQDAPPCDQTNYFYGSCKCNPSCYPAVYATASACTSSATLTAQWITVSDAYEPASDGSCRYQPNGGWLFCDEELLEKFPNYYSVQTPFRYSYQSFSATGYYRSSASPSFDPGWSPFDAFQNGWQRYFPGNMYRKDETLVILFSTSASACDTVPSPPALPGSIVGPAVWGSQVCTRWAVSGSGFTNSTEQQPLASAPQPDGDPPTRAPSVGSGATGSQNYIHLYGPKARKRFEVRFNPGERVDAFSVATRSGSYMILRSGFISSESNDYYKIRIYKDNQLISETTNPVLPNLVDLNIDGLWIADYINYTFASNTITPSDPCATYPIQYKNLVKDKVYTVNPINPFTYIANLNNNDAPEVTFNVYETSGPSCSLTLTKTVTKKLANFNSNETLQTRSVSFYPSTLDA